MQKILCFILIIVGLYGCKEPDQHQWLFVPDTLPSGTKEYQSLNNMAMLAWWQQFHDEELDRLIAKGLHYNNDIHSAIGNVQQAHGELLYVKLSWIPTIQLFAGYSTNPALGAPGGFYAIWPYYVLNIMKLYTQQKQARYNVHYSVAALEGVRLAVIGQIAAAYFTLMAQQEQLRLIRQLDRDLKKLVVISEQNIKIGLENEVDLAQLQSDEQLIAAQMKPVLHNITASQNALRYLVNENPGAVNDKNNFAQLDFSHFKPGSLPAHVLNNRPDMKMAFYALKGALAGESVAWSTFFPVVQLDELLGQVRLPKGEFATVTDTYANWNIVPASLGKIVASKGIYRTKFAEFEQTMRRILREVDTDYSANKRMNEQFASYQFAEEQYRRKYRMQQNLLQTGLISYKELIQSKIYLDGLTLKANQAKLELAMSLVVLYQDLAGGYAYRDKAEK